MDVLLQFSAKKWHVKDFGTAEVGCGTAPKKLLKALDQNCPGWVYVNADSKKFGSVDVLLQFSAKKWHVKDFGTAEVGCGTAPKKLLKALGQHC